jgi:hypothetical protein
MLSEVDELLPSIFEKAMSKYFVHSLAPSDLLSASEFFVANVATIREEEGGPSFLLPPCGYHGVLFQQDVFWNIRGKVTYGGLPLHCCNTVLRLIRSWIKGLRKMDACIHFASLGEFTSGPGSHSP